MNEVQERLQEFIKYLGITTMEFEQRAKLSNGFTTSTNKRMRNGTKRLLHDAFPELNIEWLIKGEGEMLNKGDNIINSSGANSANAINGNAIILNSDKTDDRKRIPFYDNTDSFGRTKMMAENPDTAKQIDAGYFFTDATSVIRHYGKSMIEYPDNSIVMLKRIVNKDLIIWGKNYCIETAEFRIIKRLQDGGDDFILAYSSNDEVYPDGTLVYPPIKILKSSITHIDVVLGYLIKEHC